MKSTITHWFAGSHEEDFYNVSSFASEISTFSHLLQVNFFPACMAIFDF